MLLYHFFKTNKCFSFEKSILAKKTDTPSTSDSTKFRMAKQWAVPSVSEVMIKSISNQIKIIL